MIKKGIQVEVICGKDKGKKGEVIEILRSKDKAKVKGINIIKKHEKTTKEKKGGIFSQEDFVHMSNLLIMDDKKKIQINPDFFNLKRRKRKKRSVKNANKENSAFLSGRL